MIEVTKREVMVGVVIVLVLIGLGFILSAKVHDSVTTNNVKYFRSLKVDNDTELFNYAINTEVGDMLSYGKFKANEPVSDPLIDGEYFALRKIEEHYVRKTRTVTYTDANGKTKTKQETYWTWEERGREHFNTETFNYLGRDFDIDIVKVNNYQYKDTVKEGLLSNVRYKFHIIPKEFQGTMYSKAQGKTIKDNELFYERKIDVLMESKEGEADRATIIFWVVWILLTIAAVIGFVALDNKFLNNK